MRERTMRWLVPLVLVDLVTGWSLAPGPVKVLENFNKAMAQTLHTIQSDKPGVVRYTIQGSPDEVSPFELLQSNQGAGNPIADLVLRDSWTDTEGNSASSLDRELKDQYQLMISALDNRDNELEKNMLTVKVQDQNDEKPVFTPASRNLQCNENLNNGDICGTVKAIDNDEQGPIGYGTVEYRIVPSIETWYTVDGREEKKQTGMFEVDKTSGDVKLINPGKNDWDREKYTHVDIVVQAYDSPNSQNARHEVDATITIEILDVNDEQAKFASNCNARLNIDENLVTELYIDGEDFTFRGQDLDATEKNNKVFFEFEDARNNDIFFITNPGKKNEATMSTKIPLDYETKKEYTLVVRAFNKQADQKPLSMEETCEIVVTVNDVNEPPKWSDNVPEFMEGHKEGSQSLNGVNPQAEDLDVSFPSPVRYSIIDDPEHYFKISATTGVLTVITMRSEGLDRECNHCADGKYTLKLEACDNQNLCSEYDQPIKIRDINDLGPVFSNFPDSVCQSPEDGIVIDNLKAIDFDDCTMAGHCGRMVMSFTGSGYQNLFDLEPLSDSDYRLHLKEGKKLDPKEYQLEFTGIEYDASGNVINKEVRVHTIRACSCSDGEKTPTNCEGAISTGSVNRVSEILAILIAIVALMVFIVLLIVYKRKRQGDGSKDGLLDDLDDERATVMVYSTEGGGEEDQTNYNTATLMKARPVSKEKPIKPMKNGFANSIPPEDIGQYISAAKDHADQDIHAAPYDSLLTFDYEGNNSIVDDLSTTSSVNEFGEFDPDNNIAAWGPKFRKLAELYSGRENEAFEP